MKINKMTALQKSHKLKDIILERLTPLIDNDYVLLGLPYHPNIGDSMIWEGTESFLKTTPYKCLYTASVWSYNPNYRIPKNAIIIINGGGSFGDLWRHNTKFWLSLIQQYPSNKIIILPQSIHYENEEQLKEDAEIFSKHEKLIMCLRDKSSLKIANQYFLRSEKILVPDMAFCMDISKWDKYINSAASDRVLFLNRKDAEKKQNLNYNLVPPNADVLDWPTMGKPPFSIKLYYKTFICLKKIDKIFSTHLSNSFSDRMYKNIFREKFIKEGIIFLSSYSEIYTTRLHTAILAILLQKPFVWFDNSYGKSSAFYDAWLSDLENIKFIRE